MLVVWLVAITVFGDTGKPRTDVNLRTAPNTRRSRVVAVLNTADTFEILETRRVRVAGSGAEGWPGEKVRRNHSRCAAGARSYCH